MKLNVVERLLMLNMLPSEGNIATIRLINELTGKVGFSAVEIEEFKMITKDGHVSWDPVKGLEEKEIPFFPKELELVKSGLTKLDSENKLTKDHITLYKKFIGDENAV